MLCLSMMRALHIGAETFMLVTHACNDSAMRLFGKFGFEVYEEEESHNPSFSVVMKTQVPVVELCQKMERVLYAHMQKYGA